VIDGSLLVMVLVLAVLAGLALAQGGRELLGRGLGAGASLLVRYGPLLVVSFLAAGLAEALVPHEWVRRSLGAGAGVRGILVATGAGAVTPGGPFVAMPIAVAMLRAGAGTGALVAFMSSWSLIAVHRLVAWEMPLLGWRFALLRYAVCLVLPVLAGLAARALVRS